MTLILTAISRQGVVHAADSNLSSDRGAAGSGQKVFDLPFLSAAVSVAGAFSVAGQSMDIWLPQLITEYERSTGPTVLGFAERLRERLAAQMTPEEQAAGSLAHVAGYVDDSSGAHPALYFVRNVEIEADGSYGRAGPFAVSEDFWGRDRLKPEVRAAFHGGGYQLYINGYPPGRIAYLALIQQLGEFLKAIWAQPGWQFRPPRTLQETARLLELHIQIIGRTFEISDYVAPYIGGAIRSTIIPAPQNQLPLE